MDINLDKKIYVKDLAKMCGLCESQYRKLFQNELGVSPINYLNKMRIHSALIKIGANNYTMAQISEMCGFTEQKYFNKIFRDVTGKSPSQYKKEIYNL
jgi:transcriptional regulator GlxA family with amidase domain